MQVLSWGGRRPTPPRDSKRGQSPFSGGYLTRLNKPDSPARLRGVMKHHHTTITVSCTKPWAQIPVPLALLALLLIGSVPRTALAKHFVSNQPDDYIIVKPMAGETRIIVEEPEPSWVIVQTARPPVRFEVRRPVPYAGAIWVSGYWWWSGVSYVWIRGHYVRPIRGHRFVAPRWVVSGGYHYHIRGYYQPYGATVRHRPYYHYRHVGYYGHRYEHSGHHRPTTHRGHHREHGASDRGHSDRDRNRSVHHRGSTSHRAVRNHDRGHSDQPRGHGVSDRGHTDHHRDPSVHRRGPTSNRAGHRSREAPHTPTARRGSPTGHRTAPPRGTVNRRGGTTAQRTSPSRRTAAHQRSARSSHASPVHRGRGAGSTPAASRGGGTHRGAGTARTRQ